MARVAATVGALAAATELFSWMVRHPEHPVARALARPGHEVQARFATADPDPAQLEVAEAALAACLELERRERMALNTRQQGKRLPPEIFDLPVEKMREGYYTDAYFNHTRAALLADGRHPRVVMQVFQKHRAVLGGMDEAIAILKLCSDDWDALTVHALYDGDRIEAWETVMTIEGDYTLFAHLETVYLGVLARRTLISTNTTEVLEAASGKPIIFMPARHDHHRVQTGDGYAAYVAGALVGVEIGVTTDAQSSWWGGRGLGTVPHALIAAYGGNTVLAATKFAEWAPPDFNIVVLVDFENDSVRTALEVARALKDRLWGVRLDTSGQLVDRALWNELGDFDPRGVNERLVRKVRDALDADGFERVKIVASGGFTVDRIRAFEQAGVPVDAYGVGSSLIRGENDFTGDIVFTDGRESAKVGRRYRPNPRLELVDRDMTGSDPGSPERTRLAEPGVDRVRRADDVDASRCEAGDGRARLLGEVDGAGDDDRRGAVLEEVDALGGDVVEQVAEGPGDAVALRLAGDDDRVEVAQQSDERLVPPVADLGPERRVVLRARVVALHLERGRRRPGDAVEEDRLLDRRDERVADPAEHRVVRPDRQLIPPLRLERAHVRQERLLLCRVRRPPHAVLHVLRGDNRVRRGVPPLRVDEPGRVEDLHRLVRVECRDDLGDRAEVPVDELAEAPVVVGRARDEQLEARACRRCSGGRRAGAQPAARSALALADAVLPSPLLRLDRPLLVLDAPDLLHAGGIPVRRQR